MTTPTPEQLKKLPKWIQDYVADLERTLKAAQGTMERMVDEQTVSPIYTEDWGPQCKVTRRYIQASSNSIVFEHAGVKCNVFLARENDNQRYYGIEIGYEETNRMLGGNIAIIPRGTGNIQLVHKNNMR